MKFIATIEDNSLQEVVRQLKLQNCKIEHADHRAMIVVGDSPTKLSNLKVDGVTFERARTAQTLAAKKFK